MEDMRCGQWRDVPREEHEMRKGITGVGWATELSNTTESEFYTKGFRMLLVAFPALGPINVPGFRFLTKDASLPSLQDAQPFPPVVFPSFLTHNTT